ncbi:hypothetical protein PAMP_013936 [Pampus punctatissimus]
MASGGGEDDDGGIPLDVDNVHMLLQVEHEQIQKRTFTNWINAQLSKKRQKGRGLFQQRANIETALNFLKKKSIKLVNINIPDIIDGRPSIILGLVWTIILHCHIEELASTLSFSSRHSSLDSLASLDSWSGSPVPASPVPPGQTSPLHRRFRISAKKALLMWVRDQCQKVGCSVSVKDFKSSWRSGEAFLAILCSLRPQLVDLSLVQSRSNQENLEEAFHLAEKELHIARLLEPQDVDVEDPDDKSIMTYVAQFLQYSNDMPAPDEHLQTSQSERAKEVTSWLQQTYQELLETWTATEKSSYAEKDQVFQSLAGSFSEQRRPVMTLLSAIRRCPELSQEQHALRTAWDRLEEELQKCKADLDRSLPSPLDSVAVWLQRAEAALTQEGETGKDHTDAAKEARAQQETLKTLIKDMSHHMNILDTFHNMDDSGNIIVPVEKFDEIKRRLTNIRVTAKYQGIRLEYQESRHTVLDLLGCISAKVESWKAPYKSQETVPLLLQDWHETVERQNLLLILMDALQKLKEKTNAYTSKAALGEDSQLVTQQVKEAESEAVLVTQAVTAVRATMEKVVPAWETYNKCLTSLQSWLAQKTQSQTQSAAEGMQEVSEPVVGPLCLQMVHSLSREASWLLRQQLEVESVPLKANRQKLQLLSKKLAEMDVSSIGPFPDKDSLKTLPEVLVEAEKTSGELQRAASRLEGRLAELDHWSSEALDCYQHLKEKEHRGHSALRSTAAGLISRGMQLENQVVTEGWNLQDFVDRVQKTSPLQHLSTSVIQDRVSETVSHCQEILGMFSSLGFRQHVGQSPDKQPGFERAHQMHKAELFVVARTKHVDQIGNVKMQTQDPKQLSSKFPSQQGTGGHQGWTENESRSSKDETIIVIPHVEIQMLPQSVNKVESEAMIQPQSFQVHPQASSPSQNELFLTQAPVGPKSSLLLSKPTPSTVTEEKTGSPPSQTHKFQPKSKIRDRPNTPQSNKTSPQPPVMVRSEVHSKAQSMARSRLEKARFRLQGRIQQAIKLFGGKEISEAEAKKKQRALKILQPAFLEEFLAAVEGFGAFCSGPQLQDLMLLSNSVRKQWEDVRREMASFVPILWSNIGKKLPFSVVECEMHTNYALLEASDQTDHDSLQWRQVVTEGAQSTEEHSESLRELCETLAPSKSSCLTTDQLKESDEVQETKPNDAELLDDHSGQPLWGNTLLRATGNSLPQKPSMDGPQQDVSAEHLTRPEDCARSGQEPSLQDEEQPLKACLLHIAESFQQVQTHIQTVVRGDTVETKQEVEWTVIPETAAPPKEELSSKQEVLERMASLDLMVSADNEMTLITKKLHWIIRDPVDISSLTLDDPRLVSDLKEMDDKLQSEMRKLSEQSAEEDRQKLEATSSLSLCQALRSSVHHLEQLRQQLEKVQSAVRSLDHFLATTRELKAEIPTLQANQDPSRQQNEADQEQEKVSWQAAMQQRLHTAMEQSDSVDSILKAVGMSLTTDGAIVTCQDVVISLSQRVVEIELIRARERENKEDKDSKLFPQGKEEMQENEENNSAVMCPANISDDSPLQGQAVSVMEEEESELEAKKTRLEGENDTKRQEEEELKAQTQMFEGGVLKTNDQKRRRRRRRRKGQVKTEKEEKESLVKRRCALLGALKEIRGAAEQLGLQELTLPALQQRKRTLTRLESHLASHLSELQYLCDTSSQSEIPDESQTREVEDLWEETTKAVTERLDQCCVLTELLKRFQSIRGELSGTMQRAESTINEQVSYMAKDNLQRLHNQVQQIKAELNGLGDGVEEVRSICRQLHTHLRQIPECIIIPYESEADALMDRWLDTDEDIRALQNEITTREESMECFHRRATEIQALLQSTEPPLELQVAETQIRKKIEQLKELFSEAEDIYRQMVVTKEQISARMAECCSSIQRIQESLLTLSGSDAVNILAKLKDLCLELQTQDEQVESLLEDLHVIASIAGPENLQSLSEDGIQLQEKVRVAHQIFSEVEEQTQRNIQALDRLQKESELLEEWLQTTTGKAAKEEDLTLLQEEALQQRVRTEALSQLLSSLQSSTLQQSVLVEESVKLLEQYHNFQTNILRGCRDEEGQGEEESSLRRDTEVFQALPKSTQSSVEDVRQLVDSPHRESIPSPVEQRLHFALAVENATAEGKAHLEEVGVTGKSVSPTLCDGDDLKQEIQKTIQKTEEQCRDPLQIVQPSPSVLQAESALTSSSTRQEACCRMQELQHRTAQLPTLFPWPGIVERRQACRLACQLQDETESLQLTLSSLDEQRQDQTEKTGDAVWKDSSHAELEACCSTLMAELNGVCSCLEEGVCNEEHFGQWLQYCRHKLTSLEKRMSACQAQKEESLARQITDVAALEALLQEVTDIETDLVQLVTLKDSVAASSTAEAQTSLCQEVGNLQTQKRALDSNIRENLAVLKVKRNLSVQQVKEEASCIHIALKNLAENVEIISVNHEALAHISQLKQQWCIIQDCDTRLTMLAAGVCDLLRTGESSITQEMLPADVDAVAKDLHSLRSTFLQKRQECAEKIANRVKQVITQMQQWSQTVQAEPSSRNQAALDKGLRLQQALQEVLSEGDFLRNCLGPKFIKKQKKRASDALNKSTHALETVSKSLLTFLFNFMEPQDMCQNVGASNPDVHIYSQGAERFDVKHKNDKGTSTGHAEMADGEKTEEANDCEGEETKYFKVPERRESTVPNVESESKLPASLEATEMAQDQPQMQENMEPERTAQELAPDPGAGEMKGGSPGSESYKHKATMQDILSEIQSLVERSNIINRRPHIDLNWYLKFSPGEPEIRLIRTVQKVLACRYQPARLDVTAMAKQLEEAEACTSVYFFTLVKTTILCTIFCVKKSKDYNRCVVEQVDLMNNTNSEGVCDPDSLKSIEGQWSAALLDASATVQVKAAQLDQVKMYHRQMKITRAFLDILAAEKEKSNLNALGSSALQANKLHALLQTMELKEDMMEELLRLSSQLSVHLSEAESSGALLAQLGDVQEEWRLLKGSIKRALRHALNSASQSSLLIKEAEHLKEKLKALWKSDIFTQSTGKIHGSKSMLESVYLTTDLKLYNQLYQHLLSQSDALVDFSLGQKEMIEIKHNLQELWSLLNVTKSKLDTSTCSTGCISSAKINNQLRDLIICAKQAENHMSTGKKLALFPEEARIQIVEMKKCQTDILTRRSKMQVEVKEMKTIASNMDSEEYDRIFKTVEDLYGAIVDNLDRVLDTMKKDLQEREKLLCQLASMDVWLAETHAKRDPYAYVENVSKDDTAKLESELKIHKLATVEIERQLHLVDAMVESCKEVAAGLSPGESRYLVNRLSGLWTELDGLLAHEKATSWELEELIHERTASEEELSTIQASLKQISTDLEQLRFPLAQEALSKIALLKHMLMEHQCQVQDIQHCQEAKRSSLLCTIGELQDKCKALSIHAFEQVKYLHLRGQMEESRDIAKEQIQRAKDKKIRVDERFKLCQSLLVELPLVKTQCQEAADQLEAIAQELYPLELNSEKQRIHHTVETLVSWEHSVTDNIKNMEAKLLLGLRLSSELPALKDLFQSTRLEMQEAETVNPDEKAIDIALQRCWVVWRNMESGMRVFEALGRKEKINLKNYKELYSLRDAAMKECHLQMESLSQARDSLKDYQWAAQGAIGFLHNAEATFLSAPGGFLDCPEEQRQTQQALEALEDGFQDHICHLVELMPQQPCLSRPKTEQLHINILSQLLVGRAVLEAQAQLRLESLQKCEIRQQNHRSRHEDIQQHLSGFGDKISDCAAEQVTSYDKCVAQHEGAKLLMEDLRSLAGKIDELRAGCPMQGYGVGKGGEFGDLWSRWVSLRRGVGLLLAHTIQSGEEWRDITTSMEQCCSFLASLQADVPDSSTVSFTQEEPQELLAQAEMHQAGLEQEQQALASLEHQLEHALGLSSSQGPMSPGSVGKTLVKIQENVRSLKERNLLVVAAAQAEEKERQQVQEEIGEVEQHVVAIFAMLPCSDPRKQQELKKDLSSLKAKLECIMDGVQSRYDEIPADLSKRIQEVQLSLQRAEEMVMESDPVRKLACRVVELVSGLERVKALLEQRSTTVSEAQIVLKHVWDKLDAWHSHLMILESEVQDFTEEQPDQAHLLMDQLTQPLQIYQDAAQMAEHRTAFLSKIPACLQEFEDILYSATCWLDEAQSWLNTPCSFTTVKSLQNHAKSLQLVLDDSVRIRDTLQDFRSVLAEISAVCDISSHEEKLNQNDQQIQTMQRNVLEPLDNLQRVVEMVEAMDAELKMIEKTVPKIRTILSSMDNSSITLGHLHNRQVILANVQSMQRTLEVMEKCKSELHLPQGAEENLVIFSRAGLLLQSVKELEQLIQQQASLLEIREEEEEEEEETNKDPDITTTFKDPENIQKQDGSPQRNQQEDFDVSNSEEEEEEEDESYYSSSSDTLTCSTPEPLGSPTGQFGSKRETSSGSPKAEGSYVKAWVHDKEFGLEKVETGLITMETRLDPEAEVSSEETMTETTETLVDAAATPDQHMSPHHETIVTGPHIQSQQTVEDTRLIPERPINPFTATRASVEFIEEEDGNVLLSTAPHHGLVTLNGLKDHSEVSISHHSLVEESQHAQESSEVSIRLVGHEEDDKEQQSWSWLHTQISQKLTTLKNVQEKHQTLISSVDEGNEKVPDRELMSTGSASAVLQRAYESSTMLRQIVRTVEIEVRRAVGSHPDVEELYKAVQRVLFCLDALTDLLLTPTGGGEDASQLRLLQLECVSTEMVTLADVLRNVESDTRRALLEEEPDALLCLTSLQQCLQTVQLVIEHLGLKNQHQQCVLGRHLRERPGGKAKIQQASQSLLQGITRLLELGEECLTERQIRWVHNSSQLQAVLCRHKKLLQVLGSQLAFVQHLFQREPEALKCQEDERAQLEVRAKALQQQALEKEVASQRRLQEWIRWEDSCGRLGRLLDELEAIISSGEPEGEEDEEVVVQNRLDACQQTLVQLDESRAAVGLLLDQRNVLQTEPVFAASVSQAGGALELRWQSAYRRTEQEIQRCRDIQDSRARFQTHFTSVSDWLVGANKHLKTWSDLADTSDQNQECVHSSLMELLDFSTEMEAMSVQRASVSKCATKLLYLREADSPSLRAHLTQLEVSWSQLTSDLSRVQDRLQQLLLAWPLVQLLSNLEDWLKKLEARLSQEKETVLKAKDAAQVTETLQHYQELKAGMVSGQPLLDFLSQSGPQVVGADVQALCSKRTMFAEQLGALKQHWFHLHRELESQIYEAEQIHHACANKERQLQRLLNTIEQQKKQLNQWKQPTSQTLVRKALLEWEAAVGKVKQVAAALQDLKATRVHVEKEAEHPCDITFSGQVESLSHACGDLSRQQHQEKARQGEELWTALDKSYQSLMETLDHRRAQSLDDQLEGERKRWKDMLQELKDEHNKTGEALSLWQEYTRLSDNCSLHLQHLWHQWEELLTSLLSPQQHTQATVHSVQKLQDAAKDLQSIMGDVLASSKPLFGHIEPLAANLIQSEIKLLSHDVLLLNQAISGEKKRLQEDLEQQKQFNSHLEGLEKQTQNILHKHDKDSVKDLLALSESLVGVREMSGCVSLSKQETERLHMLSRQWIDSMTRMSHTSRELQAEEDFQQKCKNLTSIQEKLEQDSILRKPQSYSNLQQMLTVHQMLQFEMIIGHQLLQGFLCDAVECMEKETEQKRSELMTQVGCMKESWFSAVALAVQCRTLTKEQLSQWRIYRCGLNLLWKLLRDVDSLLPPSGPAVYSLQQLQSCADDYQCVAEVLDLHSTVYTQTLEAGRHLCEMMTESECRSQLQSEIQAIEEAWKCTTSQLVKRRALINTNVQKWTQCQEEISNIMSELDDLKTRLKEQLPEKMEEEEETLIQKTDLSLQRLASGIKELATMKTDLSQYVAAGDSALLEQQLEQLHGQWEELCMKVSLRRQEIADRLNAWTIFNDKNKEFCDWLTQMENKVCHSGDLSIEEMVEKLKKDCMEEINLFSENKSHLKQLGEQLLLASDEAKQTQVHGSLQELKETLVTVQQLDKNMSNLRSWLSRIEAELSRPITYSVCHHQEIQRRLAEQQELQRDIEQHTEGVASVLSLCDVLLRDEDAAGGTEAESDSLQETSRSLDQRWRTICTMALDRRLRIEETWRLWCKFLDDYSQFEDWLKMAERTAANPNTGDVLYTAAKEELKKFESFQRQVHERLTQLELVNNQYRRLARENRTDRASQLKAMVHEGNRRWDTLHRRVSAVLRRLKYFTSQREEFEGTRESMLVWLTELDLQLTNVEHFSESDVHQKIQQLNSFQKEITLNTERIDGLIVFGEGLIQKSSPQDAALIEDELEELHSYCQEVFSRLVRFHQRLSQPPMITEEPEHSSTTFYLESSLELIGRPWLGRSQGSFPTTPTHPLTSHLERSGRETPVSVDSLPLEWDHTGDVGGSTSHEEDEEEEEGHEEEGAYFSAVSGRSLAAHECPRWRSPGDPETGTEGHAEAQPSHTSTPMKQGFLRLMSQCSSSIEDIKRVSLILNDEEQPEEFGLTGLTASDKQSSVIERWELHQAQSRSDQHADPQEPPKLTSDLADITSWLENVIPELDRLQQLDPAASIDDMAARATDLKEMHKTFTRYKSVMLSVNLRALEVPEQQERLAAMNRDWSRACTGLQQWDASLRKTLMCCQEFHESLHSLLLWLAHAESRLYTVDIRHPDTPVTTLQQHCNKLTDLQEELRDRLDQQAFLQALWSQLQPEDGAEDSDEAQEKLHVTGSKLKLLLRQVAQDLSSLQQRLDCESASAVQGQSTTEDLSQEATHSQKAPFTQRERPRSLFYRILRAAFPLQLLLLLLLLLPCLIPMSESDPSCTVANNFARSFYPMLRYTNGPPPT